MEKTDLPGGNDYNITHYPANTSPSVCADACEADSKCQSWTYVIRGLPAGSGDCCLKSSVPCPVTSGGASASCKFVCSKRENSHDNTPTQNSNPGTSGAKTNTTLKNCGTSDSTSCEVRGV